MIKRHFAVMLSAILFTLSVSFPGATQAQGSVDTQATAQVRADVERLAVNRDKQVEVKLRDNTKIKGHITTVEQDSFSVTDSKTGSVQNFSYSEVKQVKKSGGGMSTKTWLILGGVAAGVVTTWIIVKPALCDGGAQTRGIC